MSEAKSEVKLESRLSEEHLFFIYCMLDSRKPGKFIYGSFEFEYEPFYIGKGKGDRIKAHFRPSSLNLPCRKNSKIKKINACGLSPVVGKIREGLTETEAMLTEREAIITIGRIDTNSGPLTNMTDGGDGASGCIPGIETREKRSASLKGKIPWNVGVSYPEDIREKMRQAAFACGAGSHMRGRLHTEEEKRNIAAGLKGREVSQSTRLKIAEANRFRTASFETRRKISAASRGRTMSEESRRKISEALKGRVNGPLSDVRRQKLSEHFKAYYAAHPRQADGPLHGAIRVASRFGITLEEYLQKTKAGLKRCPHCKTWKQVECFSPTSNGQRTSWCRGCRKRRPRPLA